MMWETSIEEDRAWLAEMRQVNMSIFTAADEADEAERVVATAQVCAYDLNDEDEGWTELAGGEWMMLYLVEQKDKGGRRRLRVAAVDPSSGDLALASDVGADAELAFANADGELTEEATSFGELCCGHASDGDDLPYFGVRFSDVAQATDFSEALRDAAKAMASTLLTDAAIARSKVDAPLTEEEHHPEENEDFPEENALRVEKALRTMGFDDASIDAARVKLGATASVAAMANYIIEAANLDDDDAVVADDDQDEQRKDLALKRQAAFHQNQDEEEDDDDDVDDDDEEGSSPLRVVCGPMPAVEEEGDDEEDEDLMTPTAEAKETSPRLPAVAQVKREETPTHRLTSSRPSWGPMDSRDLNEDEALFLAVSVGVSFSKDQFELTAFDLVEEAAKAGLSHDDDGGAKAAEAATRCARQLLFDGDPARDAFWALVAARAARKQATARAVRSSIESDVRANVVVRDDKNSSRFDYDDIEEDLNDARLKEDRAALMTTTTTETTLATTTTNEDRAETAPSPTTFPTTSSLPTLPPTPPSPPPPPQEEEEARTTDDDERSPVPRQSSGRVPPSPPTPTKTSGVRFRSLAGVVGKVKRVAARHSPLKRFGSTRKKASSSSPRDDRAEEIQFSPAAAAVAAGRIQRQRHEPRVPMPRQQRQQPRHPREEAAAGAVSEGTTTTTTPQRRRRRQEAPAAAEAKDATATQDDTTTTEAIDHGQEQQQQRRSSRGGHHRLPAETDPLSKAAAAAARSARESLSCQPFQPEDFEALKVLGRGSFGAVALTKRVSDGKIFAIKVLEKRRLVGQRAESTARLERDVLDQLSRARSMPFVARMRFAFHSVSKLYIAMDFFPNGSLHAVLSKDTANRKYGRKAARLLAAELACALEHVHRACVVHRDVKPSNVLVDARGHVALSDFGLATRTTSRGADLRKRSFVGTVDYAAPELLLKSENRYGSGVDCWALGCLIFETCAGLPPFHADTTRETFAKIVRAEPKWKTITNLNPDAKATMVKLLAKKPGDRLGSDGVDGFRRKDVPWFATLPDWGERLLVTEAPLETFLREKVHKSSHGHGGHGGGGGATMWGVSSAHAVADANVAAQTRRKRETNEAKSLFDDTLDLNSPAARALRAKDHAFHGFSRPPSVRASRRPHDSTGVGNDNGDASPTGTIFV